MKDKKVKVITGISPKEVERCIENFCKTHKVIEVKQHSKLSAVIFYEEQEGDNSENNP